MSETYTIQNQQENETAIKQSRLLSEVDNINAGRNPDGSHNQLVLEHELPQLITAVMEGSMPYAVSLTYQPYTDGIPDTWLGKSAVEVAESGTGFYLHPISMERKEFEVDEALYEMRPGEDKHFISPRGSYEGAKEDHLAHDDMLRRHWLDVDENGTVKGKFMESILVRGVPQSAWIEMLRDPENIYGKSIDVVEDNTGLSIMAAHRQLSMPVGRLSEGVVGVFEAVIPYMDEHERQSAENQLELFRCDQDEIYEKAKNIALRWRDFEVSLADSLKEGVATREIVSFIDQLRDDLNDDFNLVLSYNTDYDGTITMTRELAVFIEQARRNTLWVAGAVVTNNEKITSQMSAKVVQQINDNEMIMQTMTTSSYRPEDIAAFEAGNNQSIAKHGIDIGGGCPGEVLSVFGNNKKGSKSEDGVDNSSSSDDDRENWQLKNDTCVVPGCPTRPSKVTVGPCGVCIGRCQAIYDSGGNPAKVDFSRPTNPIEKSKSKTLSTLFEGMVVIEDPDAKKQSGITILTPRSGS